MNAIGRPTSFKPEYCALARNYCRLGATREDIAEFFDVEPDTILTWIVNVPEFAAAVRAGCDAAKAKVWRSLYESAIGYRYTVERTVLHRGQVRTLSRTVQRAPDTRAGIYWLKNHGDLLTGPADPAGGPPAGEAYTLPAAWTNHGLAEPRRDSGVAAQKSPGLPDSLRARSAPEIAVDQ